MADDTHDTQPGPSTRDRVQEIAAKEFGVTTELVGDDARLDVLGDSLDVIELVMELEREFNLDIADEAIEKLKTLGDVQALIAQPLAAIAFPLFTPTRKLS